MKQVSRIRPLLGASLAAPLLRPAAAMAEGMPQLDFSTPMTVSQVVWGAIIFVVLYVVLSRTGLPLVASVLHQRAEHIAGDLEGARAAKGRADAGIAEAQQAVAQARSEAQAAINAALDEAKRAAAGQAEAANASLEARLREAEAQIGQARAAAMGALRQVATEITASVVTRLTGATPNPARLDAAVGTALAGANRRQGAAETA